MKKRKLILIVCSMCLCFFFGATAIAGDAGLAEEMTGKSVKEMTEEEIVEYVIELFMGFTGDEHTPLDKFAEDGKFMDVTRPVQKVFKGKKELAEFLAAYSGMSQWDLEILNAAYAGDYRVGIEWIWTSVHDLGPYDGIPPRGIETKIYGSSWITINEEGYITYQKDIWNKDHLVHQLCAE